MREIKKEELNFYIGKEWFLFDVQPYFSFSKGIKKFRRGYVRIRFFRLGFNFYWRQNLTEEQV